MATIFMVQFHENLGCFTMPSRPRHSPIETWFICMGDAYNTVNDEYHGKSTLYLWKSYLACYVFVEIK